VLFYRETLEAALSLTTIGPLACHWQFAITPKLMPLTAVA
jgi:hypothetical protein